MGREVSIAFEKGGAFVGKLLENEAPKTCEAFWKALPIEIEAHHTMFSGQGIFFRQSIGIDENENFRYLGWVPGTMGYRCDRKDFILSYDVLFLPMGVMGTHPMNVFLKIYNDLEELPKVGLRMFDYGKERIRFTRATKANLH